MAAYNPTYVLRRKSKDLHKYLIPGVGKRLAQLDEEHLGVDKDFPEHYKRYYRQWKKGPLAWIHTKPQPGMFEKDEYGLVQPIRNANVPVIYPDEFHFGLWGGEGIVRGFEEPPAKKHTPNYDDPKPRYWFPKLHQAVVYSEVLNKHMVMHATKRGEYLVDKHCGFDAYLLETEVNEVYAKMLLNLKRTIMLALVRGTLWPEDEVRRKELIDRFKYHILPEEEAEWHGLTLNQARERLGAVERLQREQEEQPRKHKYRKEVFQHLKEDDMESLDPSLVYDEANETVTVAKAFKSMKKKLF